MLSYLEIRPKSYLKTVATHFERFVLLGDTKMNNFYRTTQLLLSIFICWAAAPAHAGTTVPLSSLDLSKMSSGWGKPVVDRSIENNPMSIGGKEYTSGVGTHANSVMYIQLNGAQRFQAWVGVDDETAGKGTVRFRVYGDGQKLFDSGTMKGSEPAKRVDLAVDEIQSLVLLATSTGDGKNFDHADWAAAEFVVDGKKPIATNAPKEEKFILTPKPGPEPRINGPRVFGVTPGKPFIYRIPCTGVRPHRIQSGKPSSRFAIGRCNGHRHRQRPKETRRLPNHLPCKERARLCRARFQTCCR